MTYCPQCNGIILEANTNYGINPDALCRCVRRGDSDVSTLLYQHALAAKDAEIEKLRQQNAALVEALRKYVRRQFEKSSIALTQVNPMQKRSKKDIERQRVYTMGMNSAYEDVLRKIIEVEHVPADAPEKGQKR